MNYRDEITSPKIFGKNREKLLKLEIQMHMKDYIKEKEMNSKDKEGYMKNTNKSSIAQASVNSPNTSFEKNKFYNKYEKESEDNKNKNMVKNIISNNIITNNIITNLFTKQKIFSWLGIPTKYDEMNSYSKWWRFYDTLITLCNFLVMLLAIYDYELNFIYPRRIVNEYNTVRILMILLSLCAIFCVLKRHYNKSKWLNVDLSINHNSLKSYKYGKDDDQDDSDDLFSNEEPATITGKKRNFFKKGLFIDILINLMIPYPHIDFRVDVWEVDREINDYIKIQYLFSDYLYIMVIMRLFYLVRATINYSIFSDHYANTLAKERGVKCNIRFALKCMLKTHHIKIVFVFLLASMVILGFALRVLERPFWAAKGRLEFEFLTNSIWLIFITMLTIGYGDYAPCTSGGRIVLVVSGLWGVFICSLVVVCLYGLLDLSNDQFLVFIKIVKSRDALKFIEDAYCFKRAKLNKKRDANAVKENYNAMLSSFSVFKNMRNESKSIYRSNGLLYYNIKLLKQMKKFNQRFDKIEMDLEGLIINSEVNITGK